MQVNWPLVILNLRHLQGARENGRVGCPLGLGTSKDSSFSTEPHQCCGQYNSHVASVPCPRELSKSQDQAGCFQMHSQRQAVLWVSLGQKDLHLSLGTAQKLVPSDLQDSSVCTSGTGDRSNIPHESNLRHPSTQHSLVPSLCLQSFLNVCSLMLCFW